MTDAIATTGPRLKAERERRGLSSQKAADELHLDCWVIDALEAEDYERVGPSVYAKGHLKRYAALLGLPADEIMAGYESRAQAPKPAAAQSAGVRLRTDEPAVNNLPWPQIVGSIGVVLLILGVLWWKPWHPRGAAPATRAPLAVNPSAASSEAAADSDTNLVAAAAASPTPPSSGSMSPASSPMLPTSTPAAASAAAAAGVAAGAAAAAPMPAAQTAASDTDATAGTGRARLRLSFSADSWVDVHDAAGRRTFAGNGRANSVRTVAGIAPMRVYLGFASGVQLEINNRAVAIGPQFVTGDVARFEAGADGVLRRDTHSAAAPAAAPGAATPAGAPATVQTRSARPTG
jgi:cytoskeleton protein RodZ